MRPLVPLFFTAAALAGPESVEETDPRSPGKPLEIVFTPFVCTRCVAEERMAAPASPIRMMRMPVEDLVKRVGYEGKYVAIQGPHFKVLSTLDGDRVRPSDSAFYWGDMERLKSIFPKLSPSAQGTQLNAHERAHLYQIRMERLYAHFMALTGVTKPYLGMAAPYELYLWAEYADHHALVDAFVGKSNDKAGIQSHQRDTPNFMLFTQAESLVPGGDRFLNNSVFHNVAHNLADGCNNYYRETWAWLEEGLAHYYQKREHPDPPTFCWTEGRKPALFQKPDWRSSILNLVRRGKDSPLGQWCEKLQPGELTAEEQGICWSLVEWMIATDPIRFAKIFDKVDDTNAKPTCAEAIEYAFGVAPNVLHARWQEYVKREYAKK